MRGTSGRPRVEAIMRGTSGRPRVEAIMRLVWTPEALRPISMGGLGAWAGLGVLVEWGALGLPNLSAKS